MNKENVVKMHKNISRFHMGCNSVSVNCCLDVDNRTVIHSIDVVSLCTTFRSQHYSGEIGLVWLWKFGSVIALMDEIGN